MTVAWDEWWHDDDTKLLDTKFVRALLQVIIVSLVIFAIILVVVQIAG